MNEDDLKGILGMAASHMKMQMLILSLLPGAGVVDLTEPADIIEWGESTDKKMRQCFWKCEHCENPHMAVLMMLYPYDQSKKKFTITGMDLTGCMIVSGFKNLSDILIKVRPTIFVLTPEGKMRELHERHWQHVLAGYDLSEDEKVHAMMEGLTPEQFGRTDWEE